MTELELRHLVKRFGKTTAVQGISLKVAPGSLVALLGPSGCGKTTTLRMIAGLEAPSEGDIRFDGFSVLGQAPHRRDIGMVFQRYVLFPHMNVAGNVSFGLRMRGLDKAEIRRRVEEVLEVVQLTGFEERFPSQLSGGQQQRVAIARTVITDPRVMLMDEPLANLDAKLREEMRAFLTSLQKRLNITTIFVTHDQIEAIELADKIGVMFAGKIVQFGTPEDIFNRPRTPKIAEFMGTTNLIEGSVASAHQDCVVLDTAVGRLGVAPRVEAGDTPVTTGQNRLTTIRPEHIDVFRHDAGPSDTSNTFKAEIIDSVYYGGSLTYRIRSGALELTVRDRSTRRLDVREEVVVRIPPEHLWNIPDTSP